MSGRTAITACIGVRVLFECGQVRFRAGDRHSVDILFLFFFFAVEYSSVELRRLGKGVVFSYGWVAGLPLQGRC